MRLRPIELCLHLARDIVDLADHRLHALDLTHNLDEFALRLFNVDLRFRDLVADAFERIRGLVADAFESIRDAGEIDLRALGFNDDAPDFVLHPTDFRLCVVDLELHLTVFGP